MFARNLNHRLSPEDAAFFALETPESPMNIGSVAIFEGEIPYERFVEHMASRMHLVPRYQQLVVPAPLNVGRPTWEFDPEFDIRRHVMRVEIDPPGTDAQLTALAGKLYGGMIARDKPPWEMYLVEGMEGRTALVSKVHHCLVDGVGGIDLMMVTLDVSPEPPPPAAAEPFVPPPLPSEAALFADAVMDCLAEAIDRAATWERRLVDLDTDRDDGWLHSLVRALETAIPYFTTPVTKAAFNAPMRGDRTLAFSSVPFEEVRSIRAYCGGTVNDVVLAVLGGAMAHYFRERGELTEGRSLRVAVPVNVRRPDERGMLGNRISMIIVEAPLGGVDAVQRLRTVQGRMEHLKREHVADGIEMVADLAMGAPMPLLAGFGRLGPPPNWVANMVCTNVPGPMIPLYTAGHKLLEHYAIAPLAWEMGLGCAVTSYDHDLYFTLHADGEAGADLERLNELLRQSYAELRSAAIMAGYGTQRRPEPAGPRWREGSRAAA